jgi:hypothetical protein
MESQYIVQADKFTSCISETKLNDCVKRHDDKIDAFAGVNWALKHNGSFVSGFGVGIQPPVANHAQTFIVHNGQVYIRASCLKEATIKHS